MSLTKFKVQIFEAQNALIRFGIRKKFLAKSEWQLTRIGNEYSGYWYPTELLNFKGTIWGVGLGLDSSFEQELLARGYQVFGFEPETRCFEVSREQLNSPNVKLFNFGLWDKKGQFRYTGDNISIVDIFNKGDYREEYLEICSLWDIAKELSLESNNYPRVLRMNIEGAEKDILLRFLIEPLPFDVVIFQAEFLFHLPFRSYKSRVKAMKQINTILGTMNGYGWTMVGLHRNQITLIK